MFTTTGLSHFSASLGLIIRYSRPGIRGRFRQHRAPRRYPQVSRPQSGDMPPEHFLRKDILEYLYPDTTNIEKCTV